MTSYTLIWTAVASKGIHRLRTLDLQIAKDALGVINSLAEDPYPDAGTRWAVPPCDGFDEAMFESFTRLMRPTIRCGS